MPTDGGGGGGGRATDGSAVGGVATGTSADGASSLPDSDTASATTRTTITAPPLRSIMRAAPGESRFPNMVSVNFWSNPAGPPEQRARRWFSSSSWRQREATRGERWPVRARVAASQTEDRRAAVSND
jgi:hypothetical protein